MIVIQSGHIFINDSSSWGADWAWGLPLIILTVLIHVFGLSVIRERAVRAFNQIGQRHHPTVMFVTIVGALRHCRPLFCTLARQVSGLSPITFLALYLTTGSRCCTH